MSSRDLATVVKTQKAFIKELLDRLERKENEDSIIVQTVKQCVKDGYFNGLTLEQIFELAKKSIRLTGDNCKMRHAIEDTYEILCNYPQDERIALCVKYLGECSICIDK